MPLTIAPQIHQIVVFQEMERTVKLLGVQQFHWVGFTNTFAEVYAMFGTTASITIT